MTTVQRPQTTIFGKEAYPTFGEKAAVLVFALLQNAPFKSGNRRAALAALLAFCELNGRHIDAKKMDEKALENLIRKASMTREGAITAEEAFKLLRAQLMNAIS